MLNINAVTKLARDNFRYNEGAFYGSAVGLALGVGLIYSSVRHPLYNERTRLFATVEGVVNVLTHECDIDAENDRLFNDYVLICPIIPFDTFAHQFVEVQPESTLNALIPALAGDKIFRALYIPPIGDELPFGGILYLNTICSTHRTLFAAGHAQPLCALSLYAQQILDRKIENHCKRCRHPTLTGLAVGIYA